MHGTTVGKKNITVSLDKHKHEPTTHMQ